MSRLGKEEVNMMSRSLVKRSLYRRFQLGKRLSEAALQCLKHCIREQDDRIREAKRTCSLCGVIANIQSG